MNEPIIINGINLTTVEEKELQTIAVSQIAFFIKELTGMLNNDAQELLDIRTQLNKTEAELTRAAKRYAVDTTKDGFKISKLKSELRRANNEIKKLKQQLKERGN